MFVHRIYGNNLHMLPHVPRGWREVTESEIQELLRDEPSHPDMREALDLDGILTLVVPIG
jgi:hypothetical protein